MKCLCFSDSHGDSRNIFKALSKHPDAEVVFFLGDGLSDIEVFLQNDKARAWIFVRGNCDFCSTVCGIPAKKLESVTLMGKRIVLTHGDLYGVKYGVDGALGLANSTNADIVLFGHTHEPYLKYFPDLNSGVYLFNPGSVGKSYNAPASYGVIELRDGGVLFSNVSFV